MSIRIKDFVVGSQKEEGLRGAEAYAYARQMQAIREANPYATEKVMPFWYGFFTYVLAFLALFAMLSDHAGWGLLLTLGCLVIGIVGKCNKIEIPLQR